MVSKEVTILPTKRCRVCGDKAIGFNFSAVCCESCKAFFRRHAFQHRMLTCNKSDYNCKIEMTTRTNCKRCRLEKCFRIGMQKEMIFSRSKNCNPIEKHNQTMSLTRIYPNSTELKGMEYSHLLEVRQAAAHFIEEVNLPVIGEINSLLEFSNLDAFTVRHLVRFCKHFGAFKSLPSTDQLLLFKSFFTDRGAIRFAFCYDPIKEGYYIPCSEHSVRFVPVQLFPKTLGMSFDMLGIMRNFTIALYNEMENDHNLRDLLLARRLFVPRKGITSREAIRYQHVLYLYLLNRYLEHKFAHAPRTAITRTRAILSLFEQLDVITLAARQSFAHFQEQHATKLDQILMEIFD